MAKSIARPLPWSSPRQGRCAHWRTVLEECRQSGLSQAEFCRRRGIPPGTLSCWKHKLAQASRQGRRPAAVVAVPTRPTFVPVQVTTTPLRNGAEPSAGAAAWGGELEIVLADGRQVRTRGRVDPQWLGQIIRTLETLGC